MLIYNRPWEHFIILRCALYILSGSFEPIVLLAEYRVVSQPSSMCLTRSPYFISYDPRVEAPERKIKHLYNLSSLTQGTRPMASCSEFRGSTLKLLLSIDFFYA
jgi:hypothetical protein